jgi:hypothetical protein
MQSVAIFPVTRADGSTEYRAVTNSAQSQGRTAGEALDAIRDAAFGPGSAAVVVIQPFEPDEFFTAEQLTRLRDLMDCWRKARDQGSVLPEQEQAELEQLIDAELVAAEMRSQRIQQRLAG